MMKNCFMPLKRLFFKITCCTALAVILCPTPTHAVAVNVQEITVAKMPAVVSRMVVPYPPAMVWPVIAHPQALTQHAPKVKQLSRVGGSTNSPDLRYVVKFSPLLPQFDYVLRYRPLGGYTLGFTRVSGNFKRIEGQWRVVPVMGGKSSEIQYTLAMDPGFLAPQPLVMQAIRSDVPSLMTHVSHVVAHQLGAPVLVAKGKH
jgi:ribosome-associated toxin RatA of RatAB toxin-antitoxin module